MYPLGHPWRGISDQLGYHGLCLYREDPSDDRSLECWKTYEEHLPEDSGLDELEIDPPAVETNQSDPGE